MVRHVHSVQWLVLIYCEIKILLADQWPALIQYKRKTRHMKQNRWLWPGPAATDCPALHETTADKITASTCSPYATDNNLYIHRNAAIWMAINPINHLSSACMFTAHCSATPPNLQTHRRQGGRSAVVLCLSRIPSHACISQHCKCQAIS